MLKKERQDLIVEMLKEQKYCSVSMIANTLYVAPITVRRHLAKEDNYEDDNNYRCRNDGFSTCIPCKRKRK
ncbi:MAG: DeoR family transcriptional regulator [Tyzzerella sp.]|nr:DeoR family transcriptional regulator [Tyzzerella sp.]